MTRPLQTPLPDFGPLDEAQLCRLAADFARAAKAGDCLALSGDLGAGKSTFARAFIRSCLDDRAGAADVPSPTFTLVQTYEGHPPVAHFDLYRLSDPAEVHELGLAEALETGVALVEWPDRAGNRLPDERIDLQLVEMAGPGGADCRRLTGTAPAGFAARLERSLAIRRFLDNAGWTRCWRAHLTGDASARSYERVAAAGREAILMNAPDMPDGPVVRDGKPYSRIAHLAENVRPFLAVAHALRAAGLAAPDIFAADPGQGLVLLEDLGDGLIIDAERRPVPERYGAAIECLAAMHARSWRKDLSAPGGVAHRLPDFDLGVFLIETELMLDWYVPRFSGRRPDSTATASWRAVWSGLHAIVDQGPKALVLRDFHSPNVIWRGERTGTDRIGLIDFQDALWGHPAYDLASIVQDARVDVAPGLQAGLIDRYAALRRAGDPAFDEPAFRDAVTILAAQRAAKILGIFVRLDERDGKPAYLAHLPRMRGYMAQLLAEPVLAPLAGWMAQNGLGGGVGA